MGKRKNKRGKHIPLKIKSQGSCANKNRLLMFLALAILIRMALTAIESYKVDMGGYVAWSNYLFEKGPQGFYESFHVVYAPFYLYILMIAGGFAKLFSLDYAAHAYILKLTATAFDFLGGWLLYRIACLYHREKLGIWLAFFYVLNPGVFFNASIWGQFDGPQAVLILCSIFMFEKGRKALGILLFALAILTKPQSGILAPMILLYFLRDLQPFSLARCKNLLQQGLLGMAASILLYTVLVFPFYFQTRFFENLQASLGILMGRVADFYLWMLALYTQSIDDYPYATANAFNFWTLWGAQAPVEDHSLFWGLSYKMWGLLLFGLCCLLCSLYFYVGRYNPHTAYFASYVVLLTGFYFGTRMHERYLMPAILFISVSLIWHTKLRWVNVVLVSVIVLANHWLIYHLSFKEIFWIEPYNTVSMVFALLLTAVVALSLFDILRETWYGIKKVPAGKMRVSD